MVTVPISGRESLAFIEQALREVSARTSQLNAELDEASQGKAKLIAERLEAFKELAEFRTRLALVDGVIDQADQLSTQVRTMLQARQKTLRALQDRQAEAENQRNQFVAAQQELDKQIDQLEKKLDALAERARKELMKTAPYSAHFERYEELQRIIERAAEKAGQSQDEEAEKGAPYRNDPLFMYLWQRKYNSSEYEATGLIRWLDDKVARLIGYHGARANFAILTQIPRRLVEHVERLRQLAQTERAEVDRIEADKIREMAGEDLTAKLPETRSQRDKHARELEQLNAELLETGNQLKLYAEGRDQPFRNAIERTAKFIEGERLLDLVEDARETDDPGDEKIVTLIQKLADEIRALEDLAKRKRADLDKAFARKQELLRIAAEFRRARYDEPGSVFEPGSGGKVLLDQLLTGLITAAEYWARTQRGHRWRTRPGDSYRRSSDFPGWGWPSGGRGGRDGGGPDFRSGGGF